MTSDYAPAPRERKQTGVRRSPGGNFVAYCRICPRRVWRQLDPNERVEVPVSTAQEAAEQGRRHRQSKVHQEYVLRAAKSDPTPEEALLDSIFHDEGRRPCEECGMFHDPILTCAKAQAIRDRENL